MAFWQVLGQEQVLLSLVLPLVHQTARKYQKVLWPSLQ
jgi:hypothetical protein